MLTESDKAHIEQVNELNHWGLSPDCLQQRIKQHQYSRGINDLYTMEYIEYSLTDINFHTECRLLAEGKYDEAYATTL